MTAELLVMLRVPTFYNSLCESKVTIKKIIINKNFFQIFNFSFLQDSTLSARNKRIISFEVGQKCIVYNFMF